MYISKGRNQREICEFGVLEKGLGGDLKRKLGVIGRWMEFEAVSLSEVIKGVNMDRKDKRTTILESL